jgi:hypothetical protein
MLVRHNGNEYFVTNKLTLEQLLKNGAALVEEAEVTEETKATKEIVANKESAEPRKHTRKK